MIIINREDAQNLIQNGSESFTFPIEPGLFSKLQLFMTGKVTSGVELFGVGPTEIRAFGFMVEYHDLINNAAQNDYRIFVSKEGKYFTNGNWNMEFRKK